MDTLLTFVSVLKSIGGVALAVGILLAMVTIHEFGHYVAGKLLGFRINEFSVGFGPAILKKRSKKTGEIFSLRAIPLGGFCAFDGEDEGEEPKESPADNATETPESEPFLEMRSEPQQRADEGGMVELTEKIAEENAEESDFPTPKGERFNDQAPWKRIIVLIAGATMNYLLALALIVLMFGCMGRPLYQVVEKPADSTLNMEIQSVEGKETLQAGDIIMEIEGKDVYLITDYLDILNGKEKGTAISLTVLRGGERQTVWLALSEDAAFANMSDTRTLLRAMGIYGLSPTNVKVGFFATIGHSAAYSVKIGGTVLRSLGELLTGKLGIDAMGGPVTTIKVASQAAASGFFSFLNIAAFIGVNLAVFNLLPIPALDGCKVIFCLIEWIRRKPVNRKVEAMIHFIGIIFLFGFAILVDLLQLF